MGPLDPYYLDQIKGFEGFTPRASWDYKQDSIGYGTKARHKGEVIDQTEADRRLREETANAARSVSAFRSDLDPGAHAALTSLTFNAGPGWMNSGLGQAVKAGDWDAAKRLFVQYNKAGGETLPGLAARRASEVAWFGNGPTPPVDASRAMYDESYDPTKSATPKIAAALTGQPSMTAAPPISAVYDPNEMTPEAVALQRKIALGLLGQGSDISPVGHPLAALARAIQGGVGGYQRDTANEAEKAGLAKANALLAQAVQGGGNIGQTIATGLGNPWSAQTFGPIAQGYVAKRLESESPEGQARVQVLQGQAAESRNRVQMAPEELKLKQAQNAQAQAVLPLDLELKKAQVETAKEKDAFNKIISDALKGGTAPAQSAPPAPPLPPPQGPQGGAPRLKSVPNIGPGATPQSGDGFDPSMVQPIADPATAPASPQAAKATDGDVTTPLGRMSAAKANLLGMALAQQGKTEAAKQFFEAAKSGNVVKGELSKIDQDIVGQVNHLARLGEIDQQFKPEYLQIGSRLGWAASDIKNKLGVPLKASEAESLKGYVQFRSNTIRNFNQLLKDLSGTAVSAQEFERMKMQEPTAGAGIFDGDSPEAFKGKVESGKQAVKLAIARQSYLRAQGLAPETIKGLIDQGKAPALESMGGVINERGAALKQQIMQQNPGLDPNQADTFVKKQLGREFGLGI